MQRLIFRHLRQQSQYGQANQEPIGSIPAPQAESTPQRIRLRAGQPGQALQERSAELLQTCERELYLRFDARRPRDLAPGRTVTQIVQQGGLADARLSAQHQDPALACPHALYQPTQRFAFAVPTTQLRRGTSAHPVRLSCPLLVSY